MVRPYLEAHFAVLNAQAIIHATMCTEKQTMIKDVWCILFVDYSYIHIYTALYTYTRKVPPNMNV